MNYPAASCEVPQQKSFSLDEASFEDFTLFRSKKQKLTQFTRIYGTFPTPCQQLKRQIQEQTSYPPSAIRSIFRDRGIIAQMLNRTPHIAERYLSDPGLLNLQLIICVEKHVESSRLIEEEISDGHTTAERMHSLC